MYYRTKIDKNTLKALHIKMNFKHGYTAWAILVWWLGQDFLSYFLSILETSRVLEFR